MQVIILAAGKGERLFPLTRNTPKPLLQLGQGVTILEHQLDNIKKTGQIDEVLLVLGYRAEQVEAKLNGYELNGIKVRTIYNPFFAQSNNLISLWFTLPYMTDEFVVLNGDNVFNSDILKGLISADVKGNIVMVIDYKDVYDDDDMKVCLEGDLVTSVGKKIYPQESDGESIGMIRFIGTGAKKMKTTLDRMVRDESGKHIFWLAALQQIMDEGFPVNYFVCQPDDWAEIDFHPDLEFIQTNIAKYQSVLSKWEG